MDLQPVMITLGLPKPNKGLFIGLTKVQSGLKPNFSLGKSRTDGRSSSSSKDIPGHPLPTIPALKKEFSNDNKPRVPFKIPKPEDDDIKPGLFHDGDLKKEHSQLPSKCHSCYVALTRLKEHEMVSPIKASTNGLDIYHDSKPKKYRVMSPMRTQGTLSSPNGKKESPSSMPSTSLVSPETPPRLPIACNAQNDDPVGSSTPSPEQYKTISTSYYATKKKLIFESKEKIRHSSIDKNIDSQDSRLDTSRTSERNPEDVSIPSKLQTPHNKSSLISSSPTHKPLGSLSPSTQAEALQSNKDTKISVSQKCEYQHKSSYNMKQHLTKNNISKMSENINTGLPTKTKKQGDSSYNLTTHHSKSYKAKKDVARSSKKAVDKTSSKTKSVLHCTMCQLKTMYICNLVAHVTKIHKVDWTDVAKEYGIQRSKPRRRCKYCQGLYGHISIHEPLCKEKGRTTTDASSEKIQAFEAQGISHKGD